MLEAQLITKRFNRIPVVNGVSFVARPCEITGHLGPNGAGKSTTVKILTGLLQPSEGKILFDGRDINSDLIEYKRRLGYVPEEPHIYPYLSGRECLQLIGRLRFLPEKTLNQKIDDLLQLFPLRQSRHSPLLTYSRGMKQKILIASALLHNPDILILDEPLSALDVTSSLIVRNLLKSLSREGRVILFSSHTLDAVEKLCSKVIVLDKGSIGIVPHTAGCPRSLMRIPDRSSKPWT